MQVPLSIQDVRAYRGADVESNHNLLIIKFSLELKRIKKKVSNPEPQYGLDKLHKQTNWQEVVIEPSNKLKALNFKDQDYQEAIWGHIKDIYSNSTQKTLGYRKKPNDQ
ncbi:hypothetical protein QYM36_004466 [Artemia franciscana]|uniref:Uncharacterized protein n=1 Tax=Artemia franciscana TaxID=6661 RepID=A0AA88I662_ARTSF|nr:hypothetical protein QYM36_004466 [Artemia franciscana]